MRRLTWPTGLGGEMKDLKIHPPVFLLIALLASYALHRYLPVFDVVPEMLRYLGILPVIAALWIVGKSVQRFSRRETTIKPFEESTALVTDGYYEYSRNPMYLSMLMLTTGVAWLLGSITAFLPLPLLYAVLRFRFVAMEEARLEAAFGDEYLDYKRKVRRWI